MHEGAFPSVLLRGISFSVVSCSHLVEGSVPEEKEGVGRRYFRFVYP